MRIVTPVSEFFEDQKVGLDLCSVSDSLEARPDLEIPGFPWSIPISHAHFSHRSLDAQLVWSENERRQVSEVVDEFQETLGTISFHLSRDYASPGQNAAGQFIPSGVRLEKSQMIANCEQNLAWLRGIFRGEILLENNNYFATGAYETVTNPTFISQLVSNCADGLLFDVAHAKVSSNNLGVPHQEYLEKLLTVPIGQIHLSRPRRIGNGIMIDDHGLPSYSDFADLTDVLGAEAVSRIPITVEHYRDSEGVKNFITSIRGDDEE